MASHFKRTARRWALYTATGMAMAHAGGLFAEGPAATNEGPSAIERELQKLYERDGRQMPPMRRPVVPNAGRASPATPQTRGYVPPPGVPAVIAQPPAQPIPQNRPGVLQKLNPFSRRSTPSSSAPQQTPPATFLPTGPATQLPATPSLPPGSFDARSGAAAGESDGANSIDNKFDSTPNGAPLSRPAAVPQNDLDDPFPDESEAQADRTRSGTIPAPARTSPTAPPVRPATLAPVEASEGFRKPPAPPNTETQENPFTGLKLEEPARRPVDVPPAPPSRNEFNDAPSNSASPADSRFEIPISAPKLPPTPESPQPRAVAPPETSPATAPSFPELKSNDPDPFEAPSLPAPRSESSVPKPAPFEDSQSSDFELPAKRPLLTLPAPQRQTEEEEAPAASPARRAVEPPALEAPRLPAPLPTLPPVSESRPAVEPSRVQPPKQLNPEPAAELPRTPASEHERKLRMIAQRRGVGFKGFCPVTLRDERELVDSSLEFRSTFDGVTYSFASAEAKAAFDHNPLKYVPAAGGNDVIVQTSMGRNVPGMLDYALWYKDRLHLFSSRDTLETFIETLSSDKAQP